MSRLRKLLLELQSFARPANCHRALLLWFIWTCLIVAGRVCAQEPGLGVADLPLCTTVSQIKHLTSEQAARGCPVRLQAVVVYCNALRQVTVHDSKDGIYVVRTNTAVPLRQGQLIEVIGITRWIGYAPRVEASVIKVLGEGALPPPRHLPYDWLVSGREDCQWVEVRGIVRSLVPISAKECYAYLSVEGNRLQVHLSNILLKDWLNLIDATVRIRGVLGSNRNNKRQIIAPLIWATPKDITVEEFADGDPFALSVRPVATLLQFMPEGTPNRRVKVAGVVAYHRPGNAVFIRDASRGLQIQSPEKTPLKPGDLVEAVGFQAMGEYSPVLEDVIYRKVASQSAPRPANITIKQALEGEHDADLVAIEGNLLDAFNGLDESIFVLQSEGMVFNAHLAQDGKQPLAVPPAKGSRLRVTGICLVQGTERIKSDTSIPKSFRLLVRAPEDIHLLKGPRWWTPARLGWALGILSLVALAGWFWVISLRQQVREQTGVIRQKVHQEAVMQERHRMAREIHDTLVQGFAAISLQLEAIRDKLPPLTDGFMRHLDLAHRLARESLTEARRSIWALHSDTIAAAGFVESLTASVKTITDGTGIQTSILTQGDVCSLPAEVENNLLYIGREAVINAVKHAAPKQITMELCRGDRSLSLLVRDDGAGFDARQGENGVVVDHRGFGLISLHERAEQIGAELKIESRRGEGTTILVNLPLADARSNSPLS
jgi:signal transduction histidine kinase